MSDNERQQPLTDIWEVYSNSLDEAITRGFLQSDELSESYVWPVDLLIDSWEQDDVKRYVHERMTEIVDGIKSNNGVDPNLIAGYIFRSVLCGMLWQHERIGR